jgi:hypothetical protein
VSQPTTLPRAPEEEGIRRIEVEYEEKRRKKETKSEIEGNKNDRRN